MFDKKDLLKSAALFAIGYYVGNKITKSELTKKFHYLVDSDRKKLIDELISIYDAKITDKEYRYLEEVLKDKKVLEVLYTIMTENEVNEGKYEISTLVTSEKVMQILTINIKQIEENQTSIDTEENWDVKLAAERLGVFGKYVTQYGEEELKKLFDFMVDLSPEYLSKLMRLFKYITLSKGALVDLERLKKIIDLKEKNQRLSFLDKIDLNK